MKIHAHHAALALAAFCATPLQAQGFENLDAIDHQVAAFLNVSSAQTGSAFIPVDRRLRLNACSSPLQLGWYGSHQDSVLVQCPEPGSWKIYVRVIGNNARPAAPPAVMRGDAVTITLRGPSLSISQAAEALESGAVGDWIRIRVGKSNELRAQVLHPGSVGMNLP